MLREKRFEEFRETRRKDILTQAKKMFIKKGISNTSVSDLAKKLNFSRQTLYKYYKNLDEIIYTIGCESIEAINVSLQKDHKPSSDIYIELESYIDTIFNLINTNYDDLIFSILFDTYYKNQIKNPEGHKKYTKTIEKINFLIPIFNRAIEEKVIREDVDAGLAQAAIMNMAISVLQKFALRGKNIEIEQRVKVDAIFAEYKIMILKYLK